MEAEGIALNPGTVLCGRYEVVCRLGAGASAPVYKCVDQHLGNLIVAIKVFSRGEDTNSNATRRLHRELQATYSVDHPNVAKFYEMFQLDSLVCLVMEYVDGGTLDRLLVRSDLTFSRIQHILIQICRGLEAIHRLGLVHRDLKLQNILVTKSDEVKIADFGLARASTFIKDGKLDVEAPASGWFGRWFPEITGHGEVVGTPLYVSPEYVRHGTFDKQSDIYALGIIAYVLSTGRYPFDVASFDDFIASKLEWEPDPPHVANPECPIELSNLIIRAMARDRSERYSDAKDFEHNLRQLQFGRHATHSIDSDVLRREPSKVMSILLSRGGMVDLKAELSTRRKSSAKLGLFLERDLLWKRTIKGRNLNSIMRMGLPLTGYLEAGILVFVLLAAIGIGRLIVVENQEQSPVAEPQIAQPSESTTLLNYRFFAPKREAPAIDGQLDETELQSVPNSKIPSETNRTQSSQDSETP